jgi:hypothetical protein
VAPLALVGGLVALAVGAACATPGAPRVEPSAGAGEFAHHPQRPRLGVARPRVILTVSVDWEGLHIKDGNLAALAALRRDLPGVSLTHFLNGAYYTRSGASAEEATARIRRGIVEGDELGLHIHPWRSLVEAAGVQFRSSPSFFGRPLKNVDSDEGHEVELTAYEVDELRSIVRHARGRLEQAGFPISRSFRAGGWIADTKVLEAIRAEGFEVDSSATDNTWHKEELGQRPIWQRLRQLWPAVTEVTQPFAISTPAGTILEMPDTGALADYVSAEEMTNHVRRAIERARADPSHPVFVHLGLHQESASRFASRVSAALAPLRAEEGLEIVTLERAAGLARGLADRHHLSGGGRPVLGPRLLATELPHLGRTAP